MKAAVFDGVRDIRFGDRPDPRIVDPTDAVVRVTLTCVCGSDLWYYRGESPRARGQAIGHEFVGIVEEIGASVSSLRVGDFVIAPFMFSDGCCPHCRNGVTSACVAGGLWAGPGLDGGQGEALRVPHADATLVRVNGGRPDRDREAALLALSDVMGTGHHAAVSAGVHAGATVVVIGDGAVGLCGVIASRRLRAGRVIVMSRHPIRATIATGLGADEVIASRGQEAVEAILEATGGVGADCVLECVGTAQSMETAFGAVRPGGRIGYVGVPHGVDFPVGQMFARNIHVAGGLAPARMYVPELLRDVLSGVIDPGKVFDGTYPLSRIGDAYRAMDERQVIKALVVPGS